MMIPIFLNALSTALSLLIVDILFRGVDIANFPVALIAGAVIGLINSLIKPVLSTLSLPLNIVSFGGFSLIVNGFCFWLASVLVPGFAVHGLVSFLVAPVVLSLGNTFINNYFAERSLTLKASDSINPKAQLPSN